MKSYSMADLRTSMQKGAWATQARNEPKLNAAYEGASCVVLFFSVNESRAFQGYARMASKTGGAASDVTWMEGQSWGGVFKLEWQTIFDLSFGQVAHLRNPMNEHKPIKISRDGQEVEPSVGLELCAAFDAGYAANPDLSMKRRVTSAEEVAGAAKRPRASGGGGSGGGGGGRGGGGAGGGGGGGRGGGGGGGMDLTTMTYEEYVAAMQQQQAPAHHRSHPRPRAVVPRPSVSLWLSRPPLPSVSQAQQQQMMQQMMLQQQQMMAMMQQQGGYGGGSGRGGGGGGGGFG